MSSISPEQEKLIREARHKLWRKGNITYLLDANQKGIYDSLIDNPNRTLVLNCSRRLGKTYLMCVIAVETCLKSPNTIVKFVAPTQKMIKTILRPVMREIIKDAPTELRPQYKTNDQMYKFGHNNSEIQIAGTDSGHIDSLRGGTSHLCLIDEAGGCTDLKYAVKSVLLPTMTTTKGKIIIASTPPPTPDHDFIEYVRNAEYRKTLIHRTIYDNPRLTQEQLESIIKEYEMDGGIDSIEFRREYLAEIIVNTEMAVIPEFTKEVEDETIREWPRPPYYDIYTAMDIGFKDLTFVLFAYYDFVNKKIVVEDELLLNGPKLTTKILAESIKQKEETLWIDPINEKPITPFLRVCDNNLIVINDLQRLHSLTFIPTEKKDADGALNQLRIMIGNQSVIINPKCVNLIRHVKNGIWNKKKTSFIRSPDNGHYDGIDALKYLVRNILLSKNPYPNNYFEKSGDGIFKLNNKQSKNEIINHFQNMFNWRKK